MIYKMLKYDEGEKLKMYRDTEGYWTIGVGHLISTNPSYDAALKRLDDSLMRRTNGSITSEESKMLFVGDVVRTQSQMKLYSQINRVYDSLDKTRQYALVNMCFQMGVQGVSSFKNSLKLLEQKDWDNAAINLAKSKWYNQTPSRAKRVINVFKTGTLDAYN